jgi:UDP-2,4-diacetamido-2,4,6-trideoxy-beta-L-altropyranose hydrolase
VAAPVDVVADAGPQAGFGHLSRAGAVAVALECREIETRCYAFGAAEPFRRDGLDWRPLREENVSSLNGYAVVVDSYRLPPELISYVAATRRLVAMHDHGDPPEGAALVIAVAGETSDRRKGWLTGPSYSALRPAFWGLPRREPRTTVERILVASGSGQFDALGCELAEMLAEALPAVQVSLVRGPEAKGAAPAAVETLTAPESLLGPLLGSDLVVTAGGQTMLESAATGVPCVALTLADNQCRQLAALADAGAVRPVHPPTPAGTMAAVQELIEDDAARQRLGAAAQAAVDGYGALRIAFEISSLAEGP